MEQEINKLQEAISRGELFEYMVGEKDYEYVCRDADVPTEDQVVFSSIAALYKKTMDVAIWKYFEATWIELSASPLYSWVSLYYLSNYLHYHSLADSYSLDLKKILPVIISNLKMNKASLVKNKRWVGRGYKDGLWGDVKRMVTNIHRNYGLEIEL